ncbi:MAG: bifunctional DNA primase/polymerase [Peptococcaceae bacterium]|nr:bifunctional DNA primase/polymerase [Peptococcaceae bacterium]
MLEVALTYLRLGWSVIPACRLDSDSPSGCSAPWHAGRKDHTPGKAPLPSWSEYQRRIPTEAEWRPWDRKYGRYNIGLVTGAASGVLVLDLDSPDHAEDGNGPDGLASILAAGLELPQTPAVKTPSGGVHLYFAYPQEVPTGSLRNFAGRLPGVDARADGGFAVLPPSVTAKGAYHWVDGRGYTDLERALPPNWLLAIFTERPIRGGAIPPDEEWALTWTSTCPEGQRNDTCSRLAGHLAGHGLPEPMATVMLCDWSERHCIPALSTEEVTRTVRSVYRSHLRNDPAAGIIPASEEAAGNEFQRLPISVAKMLASDDPATRCGGAAKALRFGMPAACVLRCLLAINGKDMAEARRALRWAMRRTEITAMPVDQ